MKSKNDYPKALVAIAWLGASVYAIGALNNAGFGVLCFAMAGVMSLLIKS